MDLAGKNYYDILGVTRKATVDEIKEAYRSIARAYHPDSNFYSEIIDDRSSGAAPNMDVFQRITEAYTVLIDHERRRAYDELFPKNMRDWEGDPPPASATMPKDLKALENYAETALASVYRPDQDSRSFRVGAFGRIAHGEPGGGDQEPTCEAIPISDALRQGRIATPVFLLLAFVGFIAGAAGAYFLMQIL